VSCPTIVDTFLPLLNHAPHYPNRPTCPIDCPRANHRREELSVLTARSYTAFARCTQIHADTLNFVVGLSNYMLGVIRRITPVLSNAGSKEKQVFLLEFALDKTTAAKRPEHIIFCFLLSASICVHLRLINSFLPTYCRITHDIRHSTSDL